MQIWGWIIPCWTSIIKRGKTEGEGCDPLSYFLRVGGGVLFEKKINQRYKY